MDVDSAGHVTRSGCRVVPASMEPRPDGRG